MAALPVSVIVVSRGRPEALARCLTGLAQLDYAPLEVVVVACPAGLRAVEAHAKAAEVKGLEYDQPNISAARNRGIAAAAGEILAFIDDDAVPEPSWLTHLVAPFGDLEVAAAGGFVIGRNGISLQWGAATVDGAGRRHPLRLADEAPVVLAPREGRAIKTEGTNMALRRDLLAVMGGFDHAFRFYLDETDLNLRLAAEDRATALVPRALVHHGMAESPRRRADRTPRDLTEIGASTMVFLRKHLPEAKHAAALERLRAEQRQRLLRAMQAGTLDPGDVWALMRGLERGIREGATREIPHLRPLPRASAGFLPFTARPGAPHRLFAGRPWQRRAREAEARRALAEGATATVLTLSPTALYHQMSFGADGIWRQSGGLFGRARRDEPRFRWTRFAPRVGTLRAALATRRNL
ncbi:glycosyltransferase family 2 protein [Roseivivax sp.]